MVFQDTYITNAGSDVLARATAGKGKVIWGQAATSGLNSDSFTDEEMRAMTDSDLGTLTSLGEVTNSVYDSTTKSVSIQCETSNEEHNGLARTFGIWAKAEGDADDVLAIVARCGSGATPTTIAPIAQGLIKLFVDVGLELSDHEAEYVSVAEGYYASANALEETNRIVEDLANHTFKVYQDLWETIVKAEEGEKFGYRDDEEVIELTGIDSDVFTEYEVNPVWIQNGLLFFWYSLARDGVEPAHICIASIEDLRKGNRTSLFNDTTMLDESYMEGVKCDPVYIDNNIILYTLNEYGYISDQSGDYYLLTKSGNGYVKTGTVTFNARPAGIPADAPFIGMKLTTAGTVAVYGVSVELANVTYYVMGIKLTYSPRNGFIVQSYDRIVKHVYDPYDSDELSPEMFEDFGEFCDGYYWAKSNTPYGSGLYIATPSSDWFNEIRDTSGGRLSINGIIWPHYNTLLYPATDYPSNINTGLYTLVDYQRNYAKMLSQENDGSGIGDSRGTFSTNYENSLIHTPYGMMPTEPKRMGDQEKYPYASNLINFPTAVIYSLKEYTGTGGTTLYKLLLVPERGDFFRCIKKHGLILPLLC